MLGTGLALPRTKQMTPVQDPSCWCPDLIPRPGKKNLLNIRLPFILLHSEKPKWVRGRSIAQWLPSLLLDSGVSGSISKQFSIKLSKLIRLIN